MNYKRTASIVIIGVILASLSIWFYHSFGIYVKVVNNSDLIIKKAKIYYNSTSNECGKIASGKSKSIRISPTGETDVKVKFEFDGDKVVWANASTYLEPNYRGALVVSVNDKFKVTVVDSITVR